VSPRTDLSSLRRSAADFWMYLQWKYERYTSDGADCPPYTSHLFSVLPFPPLPILWNVAFLTCITAKFHCIPQWYMSSFTYISSRCYLQFASVLQAGIIFQAINWPLFFYIPEQKGPLLVVSVVKHTFTTPRIRSFSTLCARQTITNCLLWHYSLTVYYLLQCLFSIRKRTGFAGNM